jgi:hypothetical protein
MVRAALASRAGLPTAEIGLKVAASVTHLGVVARLIAPALGAAVTGHRLDMRLDGLWWQDELGGPVPLSVPVGDGVPPANSVPPADEPAADILLRRFLDEVIAPVTAATREQVPVSDRVLWGNVASGSNAAARQAAAARPDLAGGAWRAARVLFASPLLRGERQPPGPAYRRASCCLIYRVMPGGRNAVCGDCVLNGRTAQRPQRTQPTRTTPDISGAPRPGQEPS